MAVAQVATSAAMARPMAIAQPAQPGMARPMARAVAAVPTGLKSAGATPTSPLSPYPGSDSMANDSVDDPTTMSLPHNFALGSDPQDPQKARTAALTAAQKR